MNTSEELKNWLKTAPALGDIPIHLDYCAPTGECLNLSLQQERCVGTDLSGQSLWQLTFTLHLRQACSSEAERRAALLRLQSLCQWVAAEAAAAPPPLSGALRMGAALEGAGLSRVDNNSYGGLYELRLTLLVERPQSTRLEQPLLIVSQKQEGALWLPLERGFTGGQRGAQREETLFFYLSGQSFAAEGSEQFSLTLSGWQVEPDSAQQLLTTLSKQDFSSLWFRRLQSNAPGTHPAEEGILRLQAVTHPGDFGPLPGVSFSLELSVTRRGVGSFSRESGTSQFAPQ